ncbi:MAG: hypothetical protein U9Q40_02100 [Campylobacterota bacterium]|nr:hypothetical protein [Campylobacterota bacterium]
MKKIILTTILLAGALQAGNVVHYDIRDTKKPAMSKPNHPSTDLYTK